VLRCGALLAPHDEDEREAVARLAQNAAGNGVETVLQADGSLLVPGESVTDPVAYVHALAAHQQGPGRARAARGRGGRRQAAFSWSARGRRDS